MVASDKLLGSPAALINMVRRIALDAGDIVLKHFDMLDELQVDEKVDNSPVTKADQEAESFIKNELYKILPDVPFVGEEDVAAGKIPDLSAAEYFWLVDALDGTKEFISGGEDFTVNIALIRGKLPVMGVVYVPVRGHLYAGHAPGSAVRWSDDTKKEKPIHVRKAPKEGLTVVSSASHGNQEKLEAFLECFKVNKIIKRGSSLKICAIAEGKADIYPRLGPTCEWDTAAGHAVLNAAGGQMTDSDGQPLTYGGARPKFLNPEFVASSFDWSGEEAA